MPELSSPPPALLRAQAAGLDERDAWLYHRLVTLARLLEADGYSRDAALQAAATLQAADSRQAALVDAVDGLLDGANDIAEKTIDAVLGQLTR